ncbi:MAG: hypothetical protein PF489_00820 [Salinivirgaceae bacterium]|jgi:hypothetical protein|nr:hypothetical protein [Salinivirgaceae bacterium]
MDAKPVKPWNIVAFLTLVLAALALLSLIFPSDGINLGQSKRLKFAKLESLTANEPVYANIDSIISVAKETDSLQDQVINVEEDSLPDKDDDQFAQKIDTVRAQSASLKKKIQPIEYPSGKSNMFHPFFQELKSGNVKKSLIRILHYGDSQIEGDRITRYLRNRFQKAYGGSGPGLLPCYKPVTESSSMQIETSGPWAKHSVMLRKDSSFSNGNFGILGSCATLNESDSLTEGLLNYKISKYSYLSVRHFEWVRLFFGNGGGQFELSIYERDSLLLTDLVEGTGPLQFFGVQLNHTPQDLTFKVAGQDLPSFYALTLDQPTGIAVDNIAWRGSRGAEFTKIDEQVLARFFKQLNVKFIVFQYGVNVVPHIVNHYGFYERLLIRQLKHLKKAAGNIPVLVVGVSDMSRKVNGWYESYPNITKIRDAQRNAAFKSNCAFWDMYEAMGGHNSMPAWVFSEPSLARKDFTHFNYRGASIVAQMMYNAIMYDYNQFKEK